MACRGKETMKDIDQVGNDAILLDVMIDDNKKSSALYQPTNYWEVYGNRIVDEIKKLGLKDFRRRKGSLLTCFGALDLDDFNFGKINIYKKYDSKTLGHAPGYTKMMEGINNLLNKFIPIDQPYDIDLNEIKKIFYEITCVHGEKNRAKPLSSISISKAGNPESSIEINNNFYTLTSLYYYLRYAFCSKYIDFDDVKTIVELGSGCGKQVEIIRKLHPGVCYFLFDVPPALYVCEQYLKKVFPGHVVSYKDTRVMKEMPEPEPGKIFVFGAQKFPLLATYAFDLFWNCASLQEMEPDVVQNYLSFVDMSANFVYLMERINGTELAFKKGDCGVLKPVVWNDYVNMLPSFDCHAKEVPFVLERHKACSEYNESFWRQKPSIRG